MKVGLDGESAVIILGDAGLNYYLNKTDYKEKEKACSYGMYIYCVRGNHEQRPEELSYQLVWDKNVDGLIYQDPYFHYIKYFVDGGVYTINGYKVLTIGGAYSVDKDYRLRRALMAGSTFSGWFEREQLNFKERTNILKNVNGQVFDFVLTHTAPISWEPIDLFLSGIDQSQVDKTMENWLEEVKEACDWRVWCFAHYHSDRFEKPGVEMFFMKYENMDDIASRWKKYEEQNELDMVKELSPNFGQND